MSAIFKERVTDALITSFSGRQRFKEVYELQRGFVELGATDIVPGEPIVVRWRVVLGSVGSFTSDKLDVRFLIDGLVVHQVGSVAAAQVTVNGGIFSIVLDDKNFQRETIVIKDPAVARSIYRIADNRASRVLQLKVEVREASGRDPVYTGEDSLRLRREPIDATWWEWRVPVFESIKWKTGYSLVGDFVNKLRFARVELMTAELSEVRSEEDSSINPCSYEPIQIQSRNSVAVGSRAGVTYTLLHDWKWIMSSTYLILGPINKTFAYGVYFYFTDEFGNIYNGHCSARRSRHVGVPKGKRLAGVAAQTAAANALFWAATIFGWPIAAGWYGVAAAMGEIAKDPPAPDLAFRDDVRVEMPQASAYNEDTRKSFPATLGLIALAAEVAALENARTRVRAKLMGARIACDRDAIAHQARSYLDFERRMSEIASQLEAAVQPVRSELESDMRLKRDLLRPALEAMAETGLIGTVTRAMEQAGVPAELIRGLDSTSSSSEVTALAIENGMSLTPFVFSMIGFISEVVGEQRHLLAGESYVHIDACSANGVEWNRANETDVAQEMPLRRGRHGACA